VSEQSEPDYQRMYKRLREQLVELHDILTKLLARVDTLKIKLVHHVDQGEGLTHEQLVEVYAEFERLFPRRARKSSDSLDVPL